MNEKEFIQSVETGFNVSSLNIFQLARKTSLKIALRSYLAKWLYTLRLYELREIAIMRTLYENYDMIPKHTPSAVIISLLRTSRVLRTAVFGREKKLRRKLFQIS